MDVAIAGGHGQIARRLARLLANRGDRVRGLIRNPEHADDLRADGAEPVVCDLEIYFDDIVDASERIWDMLENYKEVVTALEDTNESVLSHRVNEVLRVLTSFSVVILPLTLIASMWGMNVGVPGEGDTAAFWIILGSMLALLTSMIAYFRRRGWL